jgi:hypothetical protein
MRWYAVISLFSDGRVKFLLGFVIVAIIVAAILTFVEISLSKKKLRRTKEAVDDAPIDDLRKFLKGHKTPREKLSFINRVAKEYFGRVYGTSAGVSYSVLIEKFRKIGRRDEVGFCKAMFDGYYSSKELTDDRVLVLGDLFIDVAKKKRKAEEVSTLPSVFDRVEGFFVELWGSVRRRMHERAEERRVRKTKNVVVAKRRKLLRVAAKEKRAAAKVVAKEEKSIDRQKRAAEKADKKAVARQEKAAAKGKRALSLKKAREEKKKMKAMMPRKKEIKRWVARAIEKNYSREKILDLLNEGERGSKNTKKILNIFDKEMAKYMKKNSRGAERRKVLGPGEGVASRIVIGEKNRLSNVNIR